MKGITQIPQFWRSPLFWVGLVARLICFPVFASYYLKDLFLPFVDSFVMNPFSNPWDHFPSHYFPYGIILLVFISIPKWICYQWVGNAALGVTPLSLILIKLPLLISDVGLFAILSKMAGHRRRALTFFYWLSPIVIFVNYVHGQLDIVSMMFCIASLYLVIKNRIGHSSVAFAAALLCKFHVALAVPVIWSYLWNGDFAKRAAKKILKWSFVSVTLGLLGLFFVLKRIDYVTIGSPEAMRIFGAFLPLGANQTLYLGPLLVLLFLGRLCLSSRMSPFGLLFGVGTAFGILLLTTSTMPGWYVWIVPFLSLFVSLYFQAPRSLYWGFSFLHVVYAFAFYQSGFSVSPLAQGVAFTVLQTTLLGLVLAMWWLSVRHEATLERRLSALFIGIAGDSGSGKNYFSQLLVRLFSDKNTTIVEGDDYHRWERKSSQWQRFTHLNPRANDLGQLGIHTEALAKGMSVEHPSYDHSLGVFGQSREIRPTATVVIQGLHTLYNRGLRERLSLRVFLEPDENVRLARKVHRDVVERGHAVEAVLQSMARREEDATKHIYPQKKFADWIIQFKSDTSVSRSEILAGANLRIKIVHRVSNDANILALADALLERDLEVHYQADPSDLDLVEFWAEGSLDAAGVRDCAYSLFTDLRSRTRSRIEPQWADGQDGITQLIALCLIRRAGQKNHAIYQTSRKPSSRAA